jgi:hypothetical protein
MTPARCVSRALCALAATLSLMPTAQASPLLAFEDFESAPVKDAALASLNTLVGTFLPVAGGNVFVSSPNYTNFGPGLNPTTSSILTASGPENFDWTLSFAAATVSLQIYLNDLGPALLSLYDGSDTLLASFSYAGDSDSTNNLISLSYDAGADVITRATFVSTRGGELNTGLDNITIAQRGSTEVPAPSALTLALLALALLPASQAASRAVQRRAWLSFTS